ncbi:MAG: cytochrome c oxidase assembly protein [Pseudomonadota bacterium]
MKRSGEQNRRTAIWIFAVVPLMLGASFAAVPLYDLFCRVTGYGGTTSVADAPSSEVLDQTVKVRFDANIAPDMPWEFRPVDRIIEVRIGETALAFYEAYNPTDEPIAGTANFNVAPYAAGAFFDKIACFCFELQVLGPGERVEMPVSFFVDPAIVDHREARFVRDITLSYTMNRAELPETETAWLADEPIAADEVAANWFSDETLRR